MENKPMTPFEIVKTEQWKKFVKNLEIIGAITFLAGFLIVFLRLSENKGSGILITLGGTTLSIVYFFEAFRKLDTHSKLLNEFFFKAYGLGLSVAWIYIIFTFQHWPLPKNFFFPTSIVILLSILWSNRVKQKYEYPEISRLFFLRLLVTLGFLIYTYVNFILL